MRMYHSSIDEAVERLIEQINNARSRRLIALAGIPGSGKTTLVREISRRVNEYFQKPVVVDLGMDGFHLSKAQLNTLPDPQQALARRGAPWTFDPGAMRDYLQRLKGSYEMTICDWPGFEHDIGDPVDAAYQIPADCPLILVEGLYLLYSDHGWAAVAECFDERWFFDVPMEVAMERLCQRHMRVWGMSREQALAQIAGNDRLNAELVLPTSPFADWVLKGD
ncbi:hypothetical protein [Gynuella sunshinyii]|uniref:Panthothenate kinase n=1 Tax=Gynuella sunshinyii YC6258 TaxID=1445510 RepID=A0A0C5VVG5_9GAMM|nr:hypothetical protein [Gynuella sunshinyii]AJQ97263.1 panthothenate kinase [Gynuella sunshinyii YC6258]